jgi:modulator of FtsH protease
MEYSNGPLASQSTNAVISPAGSLEAELADPVKRVLRNTYALLAMTLLFSAAVASTAVALQWRSPGMILTLAGYFGLLFAIHKMQNSAWAIPAVFALTGFMGYTLGPLLTHALALPGGAQTVSLALAATGATFLTLSGYVLLTRRDFSFMGGFLFCGMVIALVAGIAGVVTAIAECFVPRGVHNCNYGILSSIIEDHLNASKWNFNKTNIYLLPLYCSVVLCLFGNIENRTVSDNLDSNFL